MAIVADRARPEAGLDRRLTTPTRNNAGTPVGALTPAFNGELVMDTTNHVLWQAVGTANTAWMRVV
jgi:hypothetical protein